MTQEWIPVTEKLPEENGYYLVTRKIKYMASTLNLDVNYVTFSAREVTIAEYVDKGWHLNYWSLDQRENISRFVTAWMPLPKPYYDGDD